MKYWILLRIVEIPGYEYDIWKIQDGQELKTIWKVDESKFSSDE